MCGIGPLEIPRAAALQACDRLAVSIDVGEPATDRDFVGRPTQTEKGIAVHRQRVAHQESSEGITRRDVPVDPRDHEPRGRPIGPELLLDPGDAISRARRHPRLVEGVGDHVEGVGVLFAGDAREDPDQSARG